MNHTIDERPYEKSFSWRGMWLRALLPVGLFLLGFVPQVVWMTSLSEAGQTAFWLPVVLSGQRGKVASADMGGSEAGFDAALLFIILSFFVLVVLVIQSMLAHRARPHRLRLIGAGWCVVFLGMTLGIVIGRGIVYERAALGATGRQCAGDGAACWYELASLVGGGGGSSALLSASDGLRARLPYVALGVVLLALSVVFGMISARIPLWGRVFGWLLRFGTAFALFGILVSKQGLSSVLFPIVVLIVALVWVPGEVRTQRFCVSSELDSGFEWDAAFDMVLAGGAVLCLIATIGA